MLSVSFGCRAESVRRVRYGAARLAVATAAILISLVASPGAAQAQDVDWLISVEDTGFDPTAAGGTIDYRVAIDNNGFGPAPAAVTTMDFNIPAGASFVGTSGDLSNCAPTTGAGPLTMTCDVPELDPLEQVTQIVQVSAAAQGAITVDASIPVGVETEVNNNDDDETTTITAGADIGLDLTLDATAPAGGLVDFVWEATNNGPNASNGFTLSFPAPAGIINMVPPAGCSNNAGTWECTIPGVIAPGASVSRTFTGQVAAVSGSDITASASVIGQDPSDPIATNDTDTGTVTITAGTDVAIDKSRAPGGSLLVGDSVTFTLDTSYTGDAPSGLSLSDTVPGNYAITAVNTSGGWVCTTVGQDVNCTRPNPVGAGSGTDIGSVVIVTDVVSSGSATNTATITNTSPVDQDPTNNTDSDGGATITDPVVDLRANKSGPIPRLVVVGNSYNYAISTSNIGNADFWGTVVMVDTIPAGLTLDGISANGWSCAPTTGAGPLTVTCSRVYLEASPLGANATTPSVTLNTTVTGAGTLSNALAVSSPDANIPETDDLSNNATSYDVTSATGPNAADVGTLKTANPDPVVAGEILTYTLEITNAGPNTALNVEVDDLLANLINSGSGATGQGFISASIATGNATGISCPDSASGSSARQLDCTIDTLPVCTTGGNCPVITVQIRPGGNGGGYSNTFDAISRTTPDPDFTNNAASASYTLEARADVTVVKTATPDPVEAGQNLTYVVAAQNLNNGLSQADNVEIVDTLPAGVTFISASGAGASCTTALNNGDVTGAGDTVTCDMGDISNGGQRSVTIVVRPTNATQGTTLTNDADVTTDTVEIDLTNNSDSVDVDVEVPDVDLLVNKIDDIDPLTVGDTTFYTVTVRNSGPSASENVVMTDSLPASLVSYQSHTVSGGGTCGTVPGVGSFGGTLECSWDVIEAGDTETVTITILGVSKGTVTNNVSISSDEIVNGWDRLAANNTASQDTTLRTRTDVALTKTASSANVALLENFDFTIVVDVLTGAGLAEADNVSVTDNLPGNMELTGAPSAVVTAGSATSTTCTGAAGATSFSCDLGTVSNGGQVEITVPVQVTAANANPYSRTNTATVSTSSFDQDSSNNTDNDTVSVVSSSLGGTVYRDFNADVDMNGSDSGISGITMTLTGTDVDGNPVSETATTNGSGDYIFEFLPEGTYVVTRGAVNEPYLTHGANEAGSEGGIANGDDVISAIALPEATDATDYDFTENPQARVGIAKDLSGAVTTNADGSFTATFDLVVENFSLEALINVEVTDALAGANPLFGTLATPADPANDPLADGTYAIVSAPSGSCGGTNGGFNGAGDDVVATGFGLAISGTCDLAFTIRVQPVAPVPAGYQNQAVVDAEGAETGQSSATNPQLTDLSDDGTNPDADNDGQGNEAGENDPTPLAPGISPAIALIKTSDTSGLSNPPEVLEEITYAFEVVNTGNVTLTNITLTDILPGIVLSGGPIASLDPGANDTVTFTATYAISQVDIDAGEVINQATVTGTDPYGTDVTDDSGTTTGDDTPLTTPLTRDPAIALTKTAITSGLQDPPQEGDIISYTFEVTNTGNVTLTGVTLTDILPDIVLSGGPIASMDPGDIDTGTFTATYALKQSDITAGQVTNQATVTGNDPDDNPVTDDSGTTNGDDDPTVVNLTQAPAITLDKIADTSGIPNGALPGDVIPYSFTVTNSGNLILTNVTVTDLLPGVVVSGGPIPVMNPGDVDTTTYTAEYTVTLADVLANEVINDAQVVGTWGPNPGEEVTDSDSETVQVGSIEAIPEVFPPFEGDGGTTTSMLASDLLNNGPATLDNVTITVIAADLGVTLDPTTGLITLDPGYPAGEHTVEYEICSIAIPTLCDSTIETVVQAALPGIEATKTQSFVDVNGDGREGVGDRIVYEITVENTGNTPLENVRVTDTLLDLNGDPLTLTAGPDFVSADQGSPEGDLEIDEIATYSASFTVDLQAINSGGVENSVLAEALPVFVPGVPGTPEPISDVSDNGIDADGNTEDDPTLYLFQAAITSNGLTLTKTTPDDIVERGQTVPYRITVTNDNSFVVGPVDIVDTLPGHFLADPDSATLDGVSVAVDIKGLRITLAGVLLPANGSVVVEIDARVLNGARSGTHTNTVSVIDPGTGDVLVGPETADVRILPEAIFDCADVIGKVFEDHNGNGYQDDPAAGRDGGITDQNYYGDGKGGKGGKLSVAPQPEPTVERGIPGVRLVAPDGTVITTDENGLYSVPCAALPADRGSNFILKLDERTLPTGFRPTTENPRVVRLTPGVMAEINFGASIGKVVRVDLNRAAFTTGADGKPALGHALDLGIRRMVPEMAGEPIIIRLAWHIPAGAGATEVAEGRALMRLAEKRIRAEWRKAGRTQLRIETVIVRAGQ